MCGTFHFDAVTKRYLFTKVAEDEVAGELIVRAEHVRAFVCLTHNLLKLFLHSLTAATV